MTILISAADVREEQKTRIGVEEQGWLSRIADEIDQNLTAPTPLLGLTRLATCAKRLNRD